MGNHTTNPRMIINYNKRIKALPILCHLCERLILKFPFIAGSGVGSHRSKYYHIRCAIRCGILCRE